MSVKPETSTNREEMEPTAFERELLELRQENRRLKAANHKAFQYLRQKVDELLNVIGTKGLRPEELDEHQLVEFDPIGIVTDSFKYVLQNLREKNEQLAFANQEINAVFDTVGAALLVLDPKRRILAYNQKTQKFLLGHQREVFGHDCRKTVCASKEGDFPCVFNRVMTSGNEETLENWRIGNRYFNVIGRPLKDAGNNISHVVLAYSEITARRQTEIALRRSLAETHEAQQTIDGLLRSAADGIMITDARHRIVLLNRRAEELLGLCLAKQSALPHISLCGHAGLIDLVQGATHFRDDLLVEDLPFADMHRNEVTYQARVSVIRGPRNGFRGCITFLHDVTDERVIDKMKSDFISTAAHELRTPLATIMGFTDLLLDRDDLGAEQRKEYLRLIQSKSERLAHIVSDLLDISRIESGEGLTLTREPCRLNQLIADVLKGLIYDPEQHPVVVQLPDEPIFLHVDRYAMIQILDNLFSNAVKYSPDGGQITISARTIDDVCRIEISDRGIGLSPEQLEHVFEKFYRADASNTAIQGTGLGMTIVKHLVEAHGGQIRMSSVPGAGSRVFLVLPLTQPSIAIL